MRFILSVSVVLSSIMAFSPMPLFSATRYVDVDNPAPASPYTSWADAANEIQQALDVSSASDLIFVTNGVYDTGVTEMPGAGIASNRVVITNDVTVRSINGPAVTIIKGSPDPLTGGVGTSTVRCVYMNAGTLDGFTLTNGYTRTYPNTVSDKSAGGAFLQDNSTVINCIISGNHAANSGGGVLFFFGNGRVNRCHISGNTAESYGGGVAYNGGYGYLENCIIVSNYSNRAGGVYINASSGGGAISNCTIAFNHALFTGGIENILNPQTVYNSIIWSNTAVYFPTNYENVSFQYCCTDPLPPGPGNINTDPVFLDPLSFDVHLHADSPCIDAGTNSVSPSEANTDYDGHPRIFNGIIDIGADETIVQAAGFGTSRVDTTWNVPKGSECQLQYSTNLTQGGGWQDSGNIVTAATTSITVNDSSASSPSRFYRLKWMIP